MAATATGTEIVLYARRLADQEGADLRFPDAEILGYVNAGIQGWWDVIIGQRGWQWCGRSWLEFSTVTQTGADPLVTFEPSYDDLAVEQDIRVKIVLAGTEATCRFDYSLNGGANYTGTAINPAIEKLGESGVSVTLPVGAYTLNNVYSVRVQPPATLQDQKWYLLPDNFYKLQTVMLKSTGWIGPERLTEMDRIEEAAWLDQNVPPMGAALKYSIRRAAGVGQPTYLGLFPTPSTGSVLRVNYFPIAPTLPTIADSLDTFNGWGDEYAAFYAAVRMALKDENFELARELKDELRGIEKDIRSASSNRSTDIPHIQNTRAGRRRVSGWWAGR